MDGLNNLSIVDSILLNLASVQNMCEFEYDKLGTFISLMDQYHSAKLDTPELSKDHDVFNKEFAKSRRFYQDRRSYLKKRSNDLSQDIEKRKLAKEKLVALFDSLKSLDSMGSTSEDLKGGKGSTKEEAKEEKLPVMSIREQLDEEGNVIKSEVKPYNESKNSLFSKAFSAIHKSKGGSIDGQSSSEVVGKKEEVKKSKETGEMGKDKKQSATYDKKGPHKLPKEVINSAKALMDNAKSPKQVVSDGSNVRSKKREEVEDSFHPYTIREEVDEDGNIIRSSVRKLPDMESKEDENLSDDQISELLEDMDLKRPHLKIEEINDEEGEEKKEEKENERGEKEETKNKKKNDENKNKKEVKNNDESMKKEENNNKENGELEKTKIDSSMYLSLIHI